MAAMSIEEMKRELERIMGEMEYEAILKGQYDQRTAYEMKYKHEEIIRKQRALIQNGFYGLSGGGGLEPYLDQITPYVEPKRTRWFSISEIENGCFRISTGDTVDKTVQVECSTPGALFKFIGETLLKDGARKND